MGSDPPRTDCYHCSGCGGRCDGCLARVCINNMSEHRSLRRLEDRFIDKVNEYRRNTLNKCISAISYLKDNYNIDIHYIHYFNNLDCSKEILDKMENMKNKIKKDICEFENNDSKYYNRIEQLKEEHKKAMEEIKNEFDEELKNIKNQKELLEYNKKIAKKEKIKNNLENEKNEEENRIQNYINTFTEEKNIELNTKYQNEKIRIDSKYTFEKISIPLMEYSEEEKNEKNLLLANIRMIRNYSNIPNYDFYIKSFELINCL